jgi:L-threonylcarbamoyladenylate synthase
LKNPDHIIRINPDQPQPDLIMKAAESISSGGCVCLPTRCLYGLAADAFNPAAVDRIFKIKRRPVQNPLLVLINSTGQLDRLVKHIPSAALSIMANFWPGRVTLVFEALKNLPDGLTAGTGKIGVRQCGHPVAAAVAAAFQGPVTGTSANLSGSAGCRRLAELDPAILTQIDLALDAGALEGGVGSTVVDVTGKKVRILREGIVSSDEIFAV